MVHPRAAPAARQPLKGAALADRLSRICGALDRLPLVVWLLLVHRFVCSLHEISCFDSFC